MRIRLQIDTRNFPIMAFWISWVVMPFAIVALIDPSILSAAEIQSQQALAWRRLVVMFACSTQLSVGLCIKVLKRQYPLYAEVAMTLGDKRICIRAGADLKPITPSSTQCAWGAHEHCVDDINLRLSLWANGISSVQRDYRGYQK